MNKPTTYEIALNGNVGARSLRPLIDDFTIIDAEPGITRLVGVIRDPSQMHGLVAHLASMRVDIISIAATESPTQENPAITANPAIESPTKEGPAMNHPIQTTNQTDEFTTPLRTDAARRYVDQLRAFYVHAGVFAATMVVIFVVNLLTNLSAGIAGEWSAWWSIWAFIGWGLGIAIHGLVVRLNRPSSSGSTWEDRLVAKVLARS